MVEKHAEYRDIIDRLAFTTLIVFLTIVAGLVVWGLHYWNNYEGLVTIDSMDLAQTARRLFRGDGFTTGFIRPLSLLIQPDTVDPVDYYNSPLAVLSLSAFLRLVGLTDSAVLANSLFWAFLAGVLTLIFARLLFNFALAAIAALVFFAGLGTMESAFSGLSLSFVSCLLLLMSLAVYFRDRSSTLWTAALGVIAGILYLSEFDFLFLVLPIGIMVVREAEGKRTKQAVVFLAAFLLTSLPWLIRNAAVAGNPFFSLRWFDFKIQSALFPGNKISRDFDPLLLSTTLPLPLFLTKVMTFSRLLYQRWLSLSSSLLIPFFLVGIMVKSGNPRWERVKRLVLLLFFSELLLIVLGNGDFSRLLIFLPLIVLGGLMTFDLMLRRLIPGKRAAYLVVLIVFGGLNIYPGLSSLAFGLPKARSISAVFTREEADYIKESNSLEKMRSIVKSDEVIVTDAPWAVAWYANRSAVWLPWEVEQMKELKEEFPNIRFIYITPLLFKYPPAENVAEWMNIYQSGMVPEWMEADRGLLLPGDDLIMGDILFERLDLE